MNLCIYCYKPIHVSINWINLLNLAKSPCLCERCHEKLELIQGNGCKVCSRPTTFDECVDCQYWKSYYNGNDPLEKNISIYYYNDFMKELITKWKYRGDYALGTIFQQPIKQRYNQYYAYHKSHIDIVPIPLSDDRLYVRGFNQAVVLASFIRNPKLEVLTREINEKQSKKTKIERMKAKNPFKLKKTLNKRVVLVDDIYTTGRTLRHAAQLLRDQGCQEIYALTLCRA